MSRLLVFGDLHCDRRHLRRLVERAVAEHCDALASLGDLKYLPREPEGRRFLRSAGALLRRAGLELLLVDGNHDDAEALAGADARTRAPGPVRLGFSLHHLPAGTRFRLGGLRCLAYRGSPIAHAGRGWYRAAALERAAFERLAGGGEIDLLLCHDHARSSKARMLAARSRRSPRNSAPRRRPATPAESRSASHA